MSFFGFGKKPTNETPSNGVSLNLTKEEKITQLNLRKDKIQGLCMEKRELNGLTARVAVVLDYSGSMSSLYRDGTVQGVIERLLPIAMQFDDNGEMEAWIFENGFQRLPEISLRNFDTYVQQEITNRGYIMGGTQYAPVMRDIAKKYLQEDRADIPTLILFITDGDNFSEDKPVTDKVIRELSDKGIFWQFVGIGDARFSYLEKLDNLSGRVIDNANFFAVRDYRSISDDELYSLLLQEYPSWIAQARSHGIIH